MGCPEGRGGGEGPLAVWVGGGQGCQRATRQEKGPPRSAPGREDRREGNRLPKSSACATRPLSPCGFHFPGGRVFRRCQGGGGGVYIVSV